MGTRKIERLGTRATALTFMLFVQSVGLVRENRFAGGHWQLFLCSGVAKVETPDVLAYRQPTAAADGGQTGKPARRGLPA